MWTNLLKSNISIDERALFIVDVFIMRLKKIKHHKNLSNFINVDAKINS